MKPLLSLPLMLSAGLFHPVAADTLARPSLSDIQPCASACPRRGMNMATVLARYGEPLQRYAAVGQPPITRWKYGSFTVYFEAERVLHVTEPTQGTIQH